MFSLKKYDVYKRDSFNITYQRHKDISFEHGEIVKEINLLDLNLIEQSRSGYSKMATSYLEEGHLGLAVICDGLIVAMGWLYINRSDFKKKVKHCYLPPHSALLHAGWTAPKYRGRGYQKILIQKRAKTINHINEQDTQVFANIERSNFASSKNYKIFGFKVASKFVLIQLFGKNILSFTDKQKFSEE